MTELVAFLKNNSFDDAVLNLSIEEHPAITIYALREFPLSSTIFVHTKKTLWDNYSKVFVYFLLRSYFIDQQWITPEASCLETEEFEQLNWMDQIYWDFETNPHEVSVTTFHKKVSEWLINACNGSEKDWDFIQQETAKSTQIVSIYNDEYLYDRVFFGETADTYFYVQLQLVD